MRLATLAAALLALAAPSTFASALAPYGEYTVRHVPVDCFTTPCPQYRVTHLESGVEVAVDTLEFSDPDLGAAERERLIGLVLNQGAVATGVAVPHGTERVLLIDSVAVDNFVTGAKRTFQAHEMHVSCPDEPCPRRLLQVTDVNTGQVEIVGDVDLSALWLAPDEAVAMYLRVLQGEVLVIGTIVTAADGSKLLHADSVLGD